LPADGSSVASTTTSKLPACTIALIGINVAVFVAMVAAGVSVTNPTVDQLIRWGADFGPYTLNGEYWRAISSSFLHIGIIHLLVNMWFLWSFGKVLERFVGPLATAAIYLLTGIGAALLSLSWDPLRVSAGASGAIFGIMGVLIPVLYFGKPNIPPDESRSLLTRVIKLAGLNLLYGLSRTTDNMAHLGGLVTGLLIGFFLARSISLPSDERSSSQRNILLVTTACLVLLFVPVVRAKRYVLELNQAESALERKDYAGAIALLQKYVVARPDDPSGHRLLGVSFQDARRHDEAISEYERSLALNADDPAVEVNLARLYFLQGKTAQALPLFRKGVPGMEADPEIFYWYGQALNATQNFPEAEAALRKSIGLDDKDAEVHRELAVSLKAQGKTDEATQESKRADDLAASEPKEKDDPSKL
jgi:membrane associated rhomboid family serine protease/Flp pilus assembly protein TadD